MANTRPVTYTTRVSVPITAGHREALRQWCSEHDTGMGMLLRESALEFIGRADLSRAGDAPPITVGQMLQRQPYTRQAKRHGPRIVVHFTKQQRAALEHAALERNVSLASLIRDASLAAIGLKPAPPLGRGRPLGSRAAS